MFIRRKRTGEARTKVRTVRSERIGAKVRQQVLRHVGTAHSDAELEGLEGLAGVIMEELRAAGTGAEPLFPAKELGGLTDLARRGGGEAGARRGGHRRLPPGQVPKVLDNLEGRASVFGLLSGPFAFSYSSSRSFLNLFQLAPLEAGHRDRPPPLRSPRHGREHQLEDRLLSHALGITFRRLRSSPNSRSSMFVVRIALRL